jgi:hypothetical protein
VLEFLLKLPQVGSSGPALHSPMEADQNKQADFVDVVSFNQHIVGTSCSKLSHHNPIEDHAPVVSSKAWEALRILIQV